MIFIADEGIAGNSAMRTIFPRRNRGSLAIFSAEEIAHLGASKNRAIFGGAVKIAAAAAENRAILVHSEHIASQTCIARFGELGCWTKKKNGPTRSGVTSMVSFSETLTLQSLLFSISLLFWFSDFPCFFVRFSSLLQEF